MNIDKVLKTLGQDTVQELDTMDEHELQKSIVQSEQSIKETKEELEANPKYQEIKESYKALRQGYSDVKKRQNLKIQYALHRLSELGKMDSTARDEFNAVRDRFNSK